MNIDKYLDANCLTTNDVVELLKPEFPKFTKATLSMVKRGTYGVVLSQKAVGVLHQAHPPKKENRKKAHKLTIRLDDETFAIVEEFRTQNDLTMQDIVECLIKYAFKMWRDAGDF